jgi:hypothetical protein
MTRSVTLLSRAGVAILAGLTALLFVLLGPAGPASAAVSAAQKLNVMSSWSQTSVSSYNAWSTAEGHRGDWTAYSFDWSTDYCSSSPDNPLGFDFRRPCQRHDFGYRNYKAMSQFSANKSRIDSSFYADMQRVCDRYSSGPQAACDSVAWTYYQAVKVFGSLTSVTSADLDRAARLMTADKAQAAAGVTRP